MKIIWVKKVMYGTGNTIYLTECSDSKKTNTYAKEGKKFSEPLPFFAHSQFNVIKGTAETVSVFSDNTVFYGEKSFGKFGGHTEKGRYDHPKKSTRSAGSDGSSNADNITGSDCRT